VSAGGTYQLVTAKGTSTYRALDRKLIRGWLAAVITAHDRRQAARACPVGERWYGFECVTPDDVLLAREVCAEDKAHDPFWKDNPQMQYQLTERQKNACRWLDEHELQRAEAR
jgi:hypothetical protein